MTATTTRADTPNQAMKWWGWGDEGVAFSHDDKPDFAAFIYDNLGIDVERTSERPRAFAELDVPEPQRPATCAPRSSARSVRPMSPTIPTTVSCMPAARACAISCASAVASSAGCPTWSCALARRPR